MQRHPFDPISAVFGTLFGGAALTVVLSDERIFNINSRWVWPVVVIAAGLLLAVSGWRRPARGRLARSAWIDPDTSPQATPDEE